MFGLTPFELLMAAWVVVTMLIRAGEWIFRRNLDAAAVVKRSEWEQGRAEDVEKARHFTRNLVGTYTLREVYERDWKETDRRLRHLEQTEAGK